MFQSIAFHTAVRASFDFLERFLIPRCIKKAAPFCSNVKADLTEYKQLHHVLVSSSSFVCNTLIRSSNNCSSHSYNGLRHFRFHSHCSPVHDPNSCSIPSYISEILNNLCN
ncbi:hypothetical protein RJT34_19552 [Clitoria ternatea]|uniref:Uncharacterized protein n=1 Tax=Clitoria ternatea TaxID=43366 RepID=A0AAN9IRP6_CLITE